MKKQALSLVQNSAEKTDPKSSIDNRRLSEILQQESDSVSQIQQQITLPIIHTRTKTYSHSEYQKPLQQLLNPHHFKHQLQFLQQLKNYPQIYQKFIKTAQNRLVIFKSKSSAKNYYYNHIKKSKTPTPTTKPKPKTSTLQYTLENPKKQEKLNFKSRIVTGHPRNLLSRSNSRSSTRSYRGKGQKIQLLPRNDQKLIKKYLEISGDWNGHLRSARVSQASFKHFLAKRYPHQMVEAMAKYFDFKSGTFEDYCMQIQRFIKSTQDKHLGMVFECFDFNRDRYICYQDTYTAIIKRERNVYDRDLRKLKKMFEMKKSKKIQAPPKKKKEAHTAIYLSINSQTEEQTQEKSKIVPYYHPTKPESLVFQDFVRINFKGKPQLLQDFFLYIARFDIQKFRIKDPEEPILQKIPSQEIIINMRSNPNFFQQIYHDTKYPYYLQLQSWMGKYSIQLRKVLLQKFQHMTCKYSKHLTVISSKSIQEKWVSLFKYKCDYISQRLYAFLTGPENVDVTKTRFLQALYPLFYPTDSQSLHTFAFQLIDSRKDGLLTIDQIYSMFQSLPLGSHVYNQCLPVINEFVTTIFGKRLQKMTSLDLHDFIEYFPEALIAKAVLNTLKEPMSVLQEKENQIFQPAEFNEEAA